jgi:hypothetical protein
MRRPNGPAACGVARTPRRKRVIGHSPGGVFAGIGLANGGLFRNTTGVSLEITEELIARQSPEAQAIIRAFLAQIQQLQDRLNQSPRNSSAPPSTEHPHARPPRPKPR